jgi:protein-S-isoprenylcysteine O-methyltransferase Ste14
MTTLNAVALIELFLCWIGWSLAFVKPRRQAAGKQEVARSSASKLGLFLVFCGFACIWAYVRPAHFAKSEPWIVASMLLAPPSVALVWAAARHLGKQWRFVAALNADHELVQTGPYRWIRHPIYASMFGMLLATGFVWTWWPLLIMGVVFFLAGTEIRVRAEEKLLSDRFGEKFDAYKAGTRAYLPFLR